MPPFNRPSRNGDGDNEGHPQLKLYRHFGVVFNEPREGDTQARGDCPLCGREGKFFVGLLDRGDGKHFAGGWECKGCNARGNTYTFLKALWEVFRASTDEGSLAELAADRGLLYWETLARWGVCRNTLTGEWVVPGYNADGALTQLYRYTPVGGRHVLIAAPGLNQALFNVPNGLRTAEGVAGKARVRTVYVTEGPWDGMAVEEILGQFRVGAEGGGKGGDGGDWVATSTSALSLLGESGVVGVAGAGSFPQEAGRAMGGKVLVLLYDSDHPRPHPANGVLIDGAGLTGIKRTAGALSAASEPPESVHYLKWGDAVQHDETRPSGWDVRDALKAAGDDLRARAVALQGLLGRVEPVPGEWVAAGGAHGPAGRVSLEPLPCTSWDELDRAWRKAMKWTDGLRGALLNMLACACSTRIVGEQLWMKFTSPPSCLDGETPIFDPVDGTTVPVAERWRRGKDFHVYSLEDDGSVSVRPAERPYKYRPAAMYRLTFGSGRQLTVTGGHRLWDGSGYVSVRHVAECLRLSGPYPLPSISEPGLSAQTPGARRSTRTVGGSPAGCPTGSCSCGVRLHAEGGTGPDTPPSPADAPERSRDGMRGDDPVVGRRRKSRSRRSDRPSSSSASRPACSPPPGGVSAPHGAAGAPAPSQTSYQTDGPSPTPTGGEHTAQPRGLSPARCTCRPGTPPQPVADTPTAFPSLSPGHDSTPTGCGRPGSTPRSGPYAPETSSAYRPDASGRRPAVAPASPPPVRPSSSGSSRPGSSPTGTAAPTPDADRLSTRSSALESPPVRERVNGSILPESDQVLSVEYVGEAEYYDFHVPGTENYWAAGVFHHNTGKTTLCEALSVARRHVIPKDTFTSLFSGYQVDKEGSENLSLVLKMDGKTLAIKDADTILQNPARGAILSQFRALYDRAVRTQYANKMSMDHDNVNTTVILCGTPSLRQLDDSELGQRFLDYRIMTEVDAALEKEINDRSLNHFFLQVTTNPIINGEGADTPEKMLAKRLTGGYLTYLCDNMEAKLRALRVGDDARQVCDECGRFVAYFRARPSLKQTEEVQRELSTRLVLQHAKLAVCLAVVLGRPAVDGVVLDRVRKVARDTAYGETLRIAHFLYALDTTGAESKAVAAYRGDADDGATARKWLSFLRKIGVTELVEHRPAFGAVRRRWRLRADVHELYGRLMDPDGSLLAGYRQAAEEAHDGGSASAPF